MRRKPEKRLDDAQYLDPQSRRDCCQQSPASKSHTDLEKNLYYPPLKVLFCWA